MIDISDITEDDKIYKIFSWKIIDEVIKNQQKLAQATRG